MTEEILYTTTKKCICCGKEFETKRMKTSKIRIKRKDNDNCPHYTSENPMFFEFNSCVHCGTVFTDSMKPANTIQKIELTNIFMKNCALSKNERTLQEALRLSKLALVTSKITEAPHSIISGICMRIAWFNRYLGNQEEEQKFLRYAAEEYEKVYLDGDPAISEIQLVYILGEIYFLLKDKEKTKQWFNILFKHDAKDPIVKKGKDRWYDIKMSLEESA